MNLPNHDVSLYLTHNEHKSYYQSISDYILEADGRFCFKDEDSKNRSIANDEIWVLQWYPLTARTFHCVAAPTLEEVLTFAASIGE